MAQDDDNGHNGRRFGKFPKTTGDGLNVMGEEEGSVSNDPQVIVSSKVN